MHEVEIMFKNRINYNLKVILYGLILLHTTLAYGQIKNGQQTYTEVCSVCHAAGLAGAPKFGDKLAWGKLVAEGQVIITAHGYVGVRAMPPKGGKVNLSLEDFSEALNYMVNNSGGNWTKPNKSILDAMKVEINSREKLQGH